MPIATTISMDKTQHVFVNQGLQVMDCHVLVSILITRIPTYYLPASIVFTLESGIVGGLE